MSINPTSCSILACDVFQDELEKYGGEQEWHSIHYLEMGLHDQPDILRQEIQSVINQLEQDPAVESILLMYGLCGNGLLGVLSKQCQLVLPRAHDCISILLGSPDTHQEVLKKNPGTYFYTPGWVREKRVPGPDRDKHLEEFYTERYPDDEELVEDLIEADHETYAHHNCAAYVDVTDNSESESYCQKCAKSLGWSFQKLQGNDILIKKLLAGEWDEKEFVVTIPGDAITSVLVDPIQGIQG